MFSSRITAWTVWIIMSVFYAYQYILRVMPNIMMNDILQQFNINAATFGQFSGIYYIGYSLMHVPIGIMLDRFGPKKVIPCCMFLTAIGLLPIMVSKFWLYPIIGRALIGMGSSAAILGTFMVIRLAFSEERFTRMLSISVTIGLIGAIYGGGPVNYMCSILGYKTVVGIFACMGIALGILTYFIVPTIASRQSTSVYSSIKEVFLTPKVMFVCFFAGLMVGPLEGFADIWSTAFLTEVYSFEKALAASMASAIFFGMCFGSPVLSLIAEKTKSYLGTIVVAGIIMMISFFALVMMPIPVSIMSIMFVAVGVSCAYQILAIYKASTYVSEQVVGLTTAVANMIIMIFGYLFHAIIGLIVNNMGGPTNADALTYGVVIIPVALTIGTIGFFAIAVHDRLKRK